MRETPTLDFEPFVAIPCYPLGSAIRYAISNSQVTLGDAHVTLAPLTGVPEASALPETVMRDNRRAAAFEVNFSDHLSKLSLLESDVKTSCF
jgi:hypothetical protein